jgi:hypothetical protein
MKPPSRHHNTMVKMFGYGPLGEKCGDCIHFKRYRQSKRWFKCSLTIQSGGEATDWRVRWPACGKFKPRPGRML